MFNWQTKVIISSISIAVLLCGIGSAKATDLTFRSDRTGTSIFDQGRLVLTYNAAHKNQNGKWDRANYLHPVNNLSGETITEDFPKDHPHHRGIFWAWHQLWLNDVQLGDGWACKDFRWQVQSSRVLQDPSGITIANNVIWQSRPVASVDSVTLQEKPLRSEQISVMDEQNWIHVQPITDGYRIIDCAISLRAKQRAVRIGGSENVKGYGGFSVRLRLDGSETFTSGGESVTPKIEAIRAGHWLDVSQTHSGMTIINHSTNPGLDGDQASWILRRKKSMQNAAYPGRHPVLVGSDQPLHLRYRLVIHDGSIPTETLKKLSQQFQQAQPPWLNKDEPGSTE